MNEKYYVVEYWNGGWDMDVVFEGSFDECHEYDDKHNVYPDFNSVEEGMEVIDERQYQNYLKEGYFD